MENKSFKETQSFLSPWLILIFVLGLAFITGVFHGTIIYWNSPKVAALLVYVGIFATVFSMKLRTRIDQKGVFVDFKPLVWNLQWIWEEIDHVEVKKYSLWDYGGWGYRIGKDGIALTTKGSHGLQVTLKNGKKRLLGTQRPEELKDFINTLRNAQ